jgi:3-oxoadipate enol-lactonase
VGGVSGAPFDGSAYVQADDGVRIAFCDEGAPGAPAVFLCSIGTAAMSVWDPVAGPLAASWRVIRYDRRGDGDSDAGPPASHTFDTYVADALAVLDRLGVDRAVVCGMAFGARVAMRRALAAPSRVLGLALFDATGGRPAPEAERRAGSVEAARLRAAAGLSDPLRDRRWFQRRDGAGAGLSRLALAGHPDWLPGLDAIRAPTLVACGDHDPNLAAVRRLAAEIPDATFELMPMTGHASILERPDLVLDLLEAFLERAKP